MLGWVSVLTPHSTPVLSGEQAVGAGTGSQRGCGNSPDGDRGGGEKRLDSGCAFNGRASWAGHQGSASSGFVSGKGINIWRRPLQAFQKPPEQSLAELSSEVRPPVFSPFPPGPV